MDTRGIVGAGCADFGKHFFELAAFPLAMPEEWIRRVYAPKFLVGGKKTGASVSILRVVTQGSRWGSSESDGILYETPDMDLTSEFLERHFPGRSEVSGAELRTVLAKSENRFQVRNTYGMRRDDEVDAELERVSLPWATS
jgi:hypothetical protein